MIAVPGATPTSPPMVPFPLMVVDPVLVIVEPANTAKLAVLPSSTVASAAKPVGENIIVVTMNNDNSNGKLQVLRCVFISDSPPR